jgi:hypothetical protein
VRAGESGGAGGPQFAGQNFGGTGEASDNPVLLESSSERPANHGRCDTARVGVANKGGRRCAADRGREERMDAETDQQAAAVKERSEGVPQGPSEKVQKRRKRVNTNYRQSDSEASEDERRGGRRGADARQTASREHGVHLGDGGQRAQEKQHPLRPQHAGSIGQKSGRKSEKIALENNRDRDEGREARQGLEQKVRGDVGRGRICAEAAESCVQRSGIDSGVSDDHALVCDECGKDENVDLLLLCARRECPTVVHVYCLGEEMEEVPTGDWFCDECGGAAERSGASPATSKSVDGCSEGDVPRVKRGSKRGGVNVEASSSVQRNSGKGEHAMGGPGQADGRLQARLSGSKAGGQPSPKRCEKGGNQQRSFVIGGPPICQARGCDKRAYYRSRQHSKGVPQVCNQHKSTVMVQKIGVYCEVLGCKSRASYGFQGQKRILRRCSKHKEPGMVPVHQMCEAPGCLTQPTFRVRSGRKPTHCFAHKSEGMTTRNKLCEQAGCSTHASYNYPGRAKSFCSRHAQEGMVYKPSVKADLPGEKGEGREGG